MAKPVRVAANSATVKAGAGLATMDAESTEGDRHVVGRGVTASRCR